MEKFPYMAYNIVTNTLVQVLGVVRPGTLRTKLPDDVHVDATAEHLKKPEEIQCCGVCGSGDIRYPTWINPNDESIGSEIEGIDGHCNSCKSDIHFKDRIDLQTFLNIKNHDDKRLHR